MKDEIALKLKDKMIRITCKEDQYFDIKQIKGRTIQYTGSSSDNNVTNELDIYKNRPQELFINPLTDLIDMEFKDKLHREYIVKIVNSSQQKVEYHGIVMSLEYKNNGQLNNPNYNIDISVFNHELKSINFLPPTIDLSFAALVVYWTIDLSINKNIISLIDYPSITIVTAYIVQIFYRTLYIGNTWVNFIINSFTINKSRKFTSKKRNRFTKKGFEERIFKANEKYQNETKNKVFKEL